MRFKDVILFTLTFLLMGCDGSYQSNKDEMVTELKTYDNDTSSCPSSGCVFVAVGDSGILLTSSDGISWSSKHSGGSSEPLKDVTYGNNVFVIVGDHGVIRTSYQLWMLSMPLCIVPGKHLIKSVPHILSMTGREFQIDLKRLSALIK